MKKIKNIYFFAGMFCIFVCAAVLLIPVIEASRKQKIMNGVYNLKLLGQAILVYQEQNHSFPFDQNGNILFQKIPLQSASLKRYAVPDVFKCKGNVQKDTVKESIAFGPSTLFYDFFTGSHYVIEMNINPDGSVSTHKKHCSGKVPVRNRAF